MPRDPSDPGRNRRPRAASPDGPRADPAAARWVVEEIRTTSRPGQADRALRAFEDAVAFLERGEDAAAVRAATEAKGLARRSGAIREVLGIALYRTERFREALRELQSYRRMTGRVDQNHLIADSHRALGSPEKAVEPAMEAVKAPIPEEVRAEAAIVGASALADLGRFSEALGILRSFGTQEHLARPFHLRLWYVTGEILERAGRPAEAAEEFRRVARHDPEAFDAAERLAKLAEGRGEPG